MTDEKKLVIPQRNGKRLALIMTAINKAKEGNRVYIFGLDGHDKIIEPLENKNVLVKEVKRDARQR